MPRTLPPSAPLNTFTSVKAKNTCFTFLKIKHDSVAYLVHFPACRFFSTLKLLRRWASKEMVFSQKIRIVDWNPIYITSTQGSPCVFPYCVAWFTLRLAVAHHSIRLIAKFRRDLAWWLGYFTCWNGVSFFRMPSISSLLDLFVVSNAADSVGFWVFCTNAWFQTHGQPGLLLVTSRCKRFFPF